MDTNEVTAALVKAQAEFTAVEKSAKNPHFRSTYAPLDAIIKMAQPVLARHGLAVYHSSVNGETSVTVFTNLIHTSGQSISAQVTMTPRALDPQSVGGAITYGRRYGLGMVLGVATEEDQDGEGLGKKEKEKKETSEDDLIAGVKKESHKATSIISDDQRKFFFARCHEAGLNNPQVKAIMALTIAKDSTKDMTSQEMDTVLAFVNDAKKVAEFKINQAKQEVLI